MSLRDCIQRAAQYGEIDKDRAERIVREYDDAFAEMQKHMGYTQAEVEAARKVVMDMKTAAKEKRRVQQLQAAASNRQLTRMSSHKNIRGEDDPSQYLKDMISNKRGARGSTLAGKYEAVRRGFRAEMLDAMKSFRANLIGQRRNPELLKNVTRELFGESTGDAHAAAIAKSWSVVAEKSRTRFNAAGGHIPKRANWGLPQAHNRDRIRRVPFAAWRDEIDTRLNWDAMAAERGVPSYTPEQRELILDDAYKAITSDGYSRRSASGNAGRGSLANSRDAARFFTFKSADDWMAYSEKFGSGQDTFRTMLGHLDNMAMDISMMEELGPNHGYTFRFLADAARQMASRLPDPNAMKRASRNVQQAEEMMDLFQGRTNMPQSEALAKGASAIRQYLTSAHLGSAVLSSFTDFNSARTTAAFWGMNKTGPVRQLMRMAGSKELRENAHTSGLIFENAVDVGNAVARYEMENIHLETASRMADFTIRASGLGWLTEIQRQSFGMEFMNHAAKVWHKQDWAALDPKAQRGFQAYGIGPEDWALIRRAKTHTTSNGLEILRPQEIADAAGQGLADRYMEVITSTLDFSTPTTDLFSRSAILSKTRPGSVAGELARFGLQFKAFPITFMMTHYARFMDEWFAGRKKNALSYAAGLMIGNTILGGVAIQLKEMSKGRDPRDATTKKFAAAAFLQGGGAGIFGDFLFSDVNRFGSGFAETLAGPGISAIFDAYKFTGGNVRQAVTGQDMNLGAEAVQMLRDYTPGGSLWYLRLAYEREVLDNLQRIVDPEAEKAFARKAKGAAKFETQYFAPPGSSAILGRGNVRAPDLGSIVGN